jgi:hypothetical protein
MDLPAHTLRPSSPLRLLLYVVLALVCAYWVVNLLFSVGLVPVRGSDFAIYYAAANALRLDTHADIYSWSALAQAADAPGSCALFPGVLFVYPPLLAILFRPLTLLPCIAAMHVWTLLNAGLWILSTALLARRLRERWPRHGLLAVTATVATSALFWQALWGLWLGQVHILVLAGIVVAQWLAERKRPMLAGAVLTFVALIKYFPLLLIAYYLLRGRWRVVAGAALAGLLLGGVMVVAVGTGELAHSMLAAFRSVQEQVHPGEDVALFVVLPGIGPALACLVAVLYVAGLGWMWRRGDDALGSAWTVCTLLLISPLVWSYYLVWLVPVYVTYLGAIGLDHKRLLLLAIPLYVATAFPLAQVLDVLATLILWTVMGTLFLRSRGARKAHRHGDEAAAPEGLLARSSVAVVAQSAATFLRP